MQPRTVSLRTFSGCGRDSGDYAFVIGLAGIGKIEITPAAVEATTNQSPPQEITYISQEGSPDHPDQELLSRIYEGATQSVVSILARLPGVPVGRSFPAAGGDRAAAGSGMKTGTSSPTTMSSRTRPRLSSTSPMACGRRPSWSPAIPSPTWPYSVLKRLTASPCGHWPEPKTLPKVGHYTIALGSPFGLENSMSLGIVSALGRSFPMGDPGRCRPLFVARRNPDRRGHKSRQFGRAAPRSERTRRRCQLRHSHRRAFDNRRRCQFRRGLCHPDYGRRAHRTGSDRRGRVSLSLSGHLRDDGLGARGRTDESESQRSRSIRQPGAGGRPVCRCRCAQRRHHRQHRWHGGPQLRGCDQLPHSAEVARPRPWSWAVLRNGRNRTIDVELVSRPPAEDEDPGSVDGESQGSGRHPPPLAAAESDDIGSVVNSSARGGVRSGVRVRSRNTRRARTGPRDRRD